MAIKLQSHECLVKIPGRDKPLRTLTSAVKAGKYGKGAEIIAQGEPAKKATADSDSDSDTKTKAAAGAAAGKG